MRLGLTSIVADGFGSQRLSIDGVANGNFPAAGTILYTQYGAVYPASEGGSSNTVVELSLPFDNSVCDVNIVADGFGGSYYDWDNVTNITYIDSGVFLADDINGGSTAIYISELNGYYGNGDYLSRTFFHDGTGSYYIQYGNYTYTAFGYYYGGNGIGGTFSPVEVPSGSSVFWDSNTYDEYAARADGSGGYTWAMENVQYYSDGTFIYNDGTDDWYWDGSGGFRNYP